MFFRENFVVLKKAFWDFKGYSMYFALCLIAMLYIFLTEKDKMIKYFLLYYSLFTFFLVINNPIFNQVVGKIITVYEYWRMYWILPMGLIMGYAATKLIASIENQKKRWITIFSILIIIMVSGTCVYKFFELKNLQNEEYFNYNFVKTDNPYKIPDEILEICKIISEDKLENKYLMAPTEVIPYVRQYDAKIKLVYGRNPWGYADDVLAQKFNAGDMVYALPALIEKKCNYIVVNKQTELNANIEEYEYHLLKETEHYQIYVYSTVFE